MRGIKLLLLYDPNSVNLFRFCSWFLYKHFLFYDFISSFKIVGDVHNEKMLIVRDLISETKCGHMVYGMIVEVSVIRKEPNFTCVER